MLRSFAIAVMALVLCQSPLVGQNRLRVQLQISDATDGLLASAFRSALDSISDVDITGPGEADNDFIIRVIAVCSENCKTTPNYTLSIHVSSPLLDRHIQNIIGASDSLQSIQPAVRSRIVENIRGYERYRIGWAGQWDRDDYQSEVSDLIAGIDASCFEAQRVIRRAAERNRIGDREAAQAMLEQYANLTRAC